MGVDGPRITRNKNLVYVSGLSWYTKDDRLCEFFGDCGDVVEAKVFSDKETGRPSGRGIVKFAEPDAAKRALQLDGEALDGRKIIVREYTNDGPRKQDPNRHEVFLASISWSTTAESVAKHFESCGPIVDINIFTDKESGESRGCGKVVFETAEAAQLAFAKNLTELDNWTIAVKAPSSERPPQARYWHDTRWNAADERAERRRGKTEQQAASEGTANASVADAVSAQPPTSIVARPVLPAVPNLSIKEWLETMDPRGGLLIYQDAIESQLDSLQHLVSVYLTSGPDGHVVNNEFFDHMGVQKIGHKRFFLRWFQSLPPVKP
eukprot:gnl/MRDRNA2_/MRDRNA2_97974_c0_seq1.p1 gnl/MRDRNA2_/MRDRNA2_97974_c0~~gnl/MRDRNA2_/MRDRNA2_97974_c0_seq1.p1  ORF type:complete len:322 (-),score=60.09 gnl/MRDRNA2_/MRDRNA2_97974_c0_seq1:9-974(-)